MKIENNKGNVPCACFLTSVSDSNNLPQETSAHLVFGPSVANIKQNFLPGLYLHGLIVDIIKEFHVMLVL